MDQFKLNYGLTISMIYLFVFLFLSWWYWQLNQDEDYYDDTQFMLNLIDVNGSRGRLDHVGWSIDDVSDDDNLVESLNK